jgi:hypothetical protein
VKNQLPVLALTIVMLATMGVAGQSQSPSIQGAWRAVEVTLTGPGARTITNPGATLTVVSGKHYARVEEQSESPRPVLADVSKASADELRATWGPFVGEAGSYELTGDMLTTRPVVAKNPAAMAAGAYSVYRCKVDGNTLTLTTLRNQNGPVANPATIKLARVE